MGDDVTFDWEFNRTAHGDVDGVRIQKAEPKKAVTFLRWVNGKPELDQDNVRNYSNAGMTLSNVSKSQAGTYTSVIYLANRDQLHGLANLTVNDGTYRYPKGTIEQVFNIANCSTCMYIAITKLLFFRYHSSNAKI